MSIRSMCYGVLVGASLLFMACGPISDEEQQASPLPEERAELAQELRPACTGQEPGQKFVSRDPEQCLLIDFICAEGFTQFSNECGCGCQKEARACNYDNPNRLYVSRDPTECLTINFLCIRGFTPFFDDCGCGCQRHGRP